MSLPSAENVHLSGCTRKLCGVVPVFDDPSPELFGYGLGEGAWDGWWGTQAGELSLCSSHLVLHVSRSRTRMQLLGILNPMSKAK